MPTIIRSQTFCLKGKHCIIVDAINLSAQHLDTSFILTQKFYWSTWCSMRLTLLLSCFPLVLIFSQTLCFRDMHEVHTTRQQQTWVMFQQSALCFLFGTLFLCCLIAEALLHRNTIWKYNMKIQYEDKNTTWTWRRCEKVQLQKSAWTRPQNSCQRNSGPC